MELDQFFLRFGRPRNAFPVFTTPSLQRYNVKGRPVSIFWSVYKRLHALFEVYSIISVNISVSTLQQISVS